MFLNLKLLVGIRGVQFDNQRVFVHQVLEPNILSIFLSLN